MKRIFVSLPFLIPLSTYANAQEIPVAEWFGGYSYSRITPDFLAEGSNTHGWHADVVTNWGRGGGQLQSRVSTGVVLRLGKQ